MGTSYVIWVTAVHPTGGACTRCVKGEGTMAAHVTVNDQLAGTPIFDELREALGDWDIEELIGHTEAESSR
jgi:hypothetical protein